MTTSPHNVTYPQVILKSGREKPLKQRHPWIFSGAIQKLPKVAPGAIVDVVSREGDFLGRGYCNEKSQIQVRLLTWDPNEAVDDEFFERRILASVARRRHLQDSPQTNAYRLVFSEADLLPGLIVDNYDGWLVLQTLTMGMEVRKAAVINILQRHLKPHGIIERNDEAVRELEGLPLLVEKHGAKTLPDNGQITIREHDLLYTIDILAGQKTGFYLDQRNNRLLISRLAEQRRVLNCFSYLGGFSVGAAAAQATSVMSIDSSAKYLEMAQNNLRLNQLGHRSQDSFVRGDVFALLRQLRQEGKRFDLIILDPPKLVTSQKNIDSALRGYKDINLLAFQLLDVGGLLATFSCSGLVSSDLFQKVIFGAALDAKVDAQIVGNFTQAEDHPILLTAPESAYLKGLLCLKVF